MDRDMTVKQIQNLLQYLGYYEGIPDGISGPLTKQAVTAFQEAFGGIAVDGDPGAETRKALTHAVAYGMPERDTVPESDTGSQTGTFWDDIEFFTREEFRCQCGGKYCNGFPAEPEEKMVRTVDEIRRRLGVPVEIVTAGGSGVRCPVHNANVGGVANSNHLGGNAADLHSGKSPQEMARVAEEVMGNTGEIGIYDWGIHVGVNCKYSRFYG